MNSLLENIPIPPQAEKVAMMARILLEKSYPKVTWSARSRNDRIIVRWKCGPSLGEIADQLSMLRHSVLELKDGTFLALILGVTCQRTGSSGRKKIRRFSSDIDRRTINKGAEYAFTGFKSYTNVRKMAYYKRALPTIIALMLMVFPIVIPFVMIWKSYDLGALITAGVAYFAVRFMTALFEIGMYVERQLMESVVDGYGAVSGYLLTGQLESAEGLLAFSFVLYAIFFIVPAMFIYFAVAMGMSFNTFMNAQGAGIGHVEPDSGIGMAAGAVGGRISKFGGMK